MLLAGCAGDPTAEPIEFTEPETGIEYDPRIVGAPDDEVRALLEESLLIFRREDDGAQSVAFLRRRAEGDIPTAQKILRSFGYYGATVTAEVREPDGRVARDNDRAPRRLAGPREGNQEEIGGEAPPPPEPELIAEIVIESAVPFILTEHRVTLEDYAPDGPPTLGPAEAYGSPVGAPARAASIIGAEGAMVADLRGSGRPYAEAEGRRALADRDASTLEVTTLIRTGRAYRFGPVTFEGAPNVKERYLRTYQPWEEGDTVDAAQLAEYQRALMATGLFNAGSVKLPEEPPEGEVAPVAVTLEEAPFRTVSAGVRWSTDEGPGVRLGFEHRNLFHANERLRLELDASLDEQILTGTIRKPQFLRDGQALTAGLELRRITDDAFDELGGTATVGIERALGERWTVGAGILGEVSFIEDDGEDSTAYLGGLPLFVAYDGSDDLLDPTTGERFRLDTTPFLGAFDGSAVTFLRLDATGSIYRSLDEKGHYVVAGRTRIGSILSGELDDVPAPRRLYSGGGGSVRGYQERFIGPLDDQNDPIGGRSVFEVGAEFRGRIWGDLGGAVFVEAGSVSTEVVPDFNDGLQVAAGAGVRYYSPIGPIRLDVGVPLNPRDADDAFQVYISIGQAF